MPCIRPAGGVANPALCSTMFYSFYIYLDVMRKILVILFSFFFFFFNQELACGIIAKANDKDKVLLKKIEFSN